MVNQFYEAEVVSEYVIRGNAAVIKCNIPSFVADFVRVDAWVATDGTVYRPSLDYGISIFELCTLNQMDDCVFRSWRHTLIFLWQLPFQLVERQNLRN